MSVVAFDALKFARTLEQHGFTHEQATGASDALADAMGSMNVASRADVLGEGASVRTELKAEVASVRTDLKVEIASVRTELKAEIASVRTELKAESASLRAEIKASAAETKADILRWLVVTQIALAGFIFAAVRFVH